jgi:class 3 adenylate cyclase/tetratricopeptide (TPR) repeat protein
MAGSLCDNCGTENPPQARFCMSCGSGLERRCPSCNAVAPDQAKFCMSCGAALEEGAPVPHGQNEAPAKVTSGPWPGAATGLPEERRQVTILFADLSGYTAVAENMDPEAVKSLVDRSLKRLGQEVERFGGRVDKYIGDNVMAIFGAPIAHEDDPERAMRAALGMQDAMTEINEQLDRSHSVSFALRVGVNTGEVVAGAVGDGYTVIGDAVNVAARLQSAARPGTITVGERTYRATSGAIQYRPLEPLVLKGKAEPVPAWEATGVLAAQPQRRSAARESPLVGRQDKLELLESLYERVAHEGRPHLVTVIGQAGVGKSRLLTELTKRLGENEAQPTFRTGHCLPYGSGIVYWALAEVIRSEACIVDSDDSEVAWSKLENTMKELLGAEGGEHGESGRKAAVIARLLGIDAPFDAALLESDDPQRMREAFFSAVRSAVEAMAQRNPLILAFEDIHWADHGMLDLIEYLAQWVRGPMVLLCLARDELLERRSSWGGGRRETTSIVLDPLTADETRTLVSSLLSAEEAVPEAVAVVTERAGGNPFFAEEMVRRLEEEHTGEAVELPDTVQALLAARLDSLEPFERRLVQHASVVGRTFWEGSLETVARNEDGELWQALTTLQEKDIIVPDSGGRLADEREFSFKHVLIRDVAYGMLPKSVRCQKHFEIGSFIEQRAGDRTDEVVALLAEHYGRAAALGEEVGLGHEQIEPIHGKALHFLEAAGDAASLLYSNPEAFAHYQAARDVNCPHDPGTIARIGEKQGDVALRLGRVDVALEVWEECLEYHRQQEDLNRVADLHRKVGAGLWHKGERKQAIERYQKGINLLKDGPPCLELVRLYEEAASLYMHAGDNMLAIYASEKALRLAERMGETRAASRAHGIFGRVFGRIGDTAKARENLERSVELGRDSDQGETIRALLTLGHHLEVSEADYKGAGEAYTEALGLARQIGELPAQVELHSALAQLAVYRADWKQVQISTEASANLAEREGLVGKLCFPYVLRGVLNWRAGNWDAAEEACRRAHELADQVGWSEVAFEALYCLATTLRDKGDFSAAVTELDRALDVCERAGLIAQSIEAMSARAVALVLAGRHEQGRETAEEAGYLAERLHYPVGHAAALEARGATSTDTEEGTKMLAEARQTWLDLNRPLDAAGCDLIKGMLLRDANPAEAQAAFDAALAALEILDVPHMTELARSKGALARGGFAAKEAP